MNPAKLYTTIIFFLIFSQRIKLKTIKFYQFDFHLYSVIQINSDRGGLEISNFSFPFEVYINLTVNLSGITNQRQIQNLQIPQSSPDSESFIIYFDIVDTSVDVLSVNCGISFTDDTINLPPEINSFTPVYEK